MTLLEISLVLLGFACWNHFWLDEDEPKVQKQSVKQPEIDYRKRDEAFRKGDEYARSLERRDHAAKKKSHRCGNTRGSNEHQINLYSDFTTSRR